MAREAVSARDVLAQQVRDAIATVPVSLRRLGVETNLSTTYICEVRDGIRTPTELRAARILETIKRLHVVFGTAQKTKKTGEDAKAHVRGARRRTLGTSGRRQRATHATRHSTAEEN